MAVQDRESAQQSQAESLLKNYDFDQATRLAVALRDEPDLRLHQLKGWSMQFLEEVESGRKEQLERIETLLTEALLCINSNPDFSLI